MRTFGLLLWALVGTSCGDLDVRSVRTPSTQPSAFAGEWAGTFQSANVDATSGAVNVQVQFFRDEPIVRIQFPHPCLEAGDYGLSLRDGVIELSIAGATVLRGELQDGELVGTFTCAADHGTWRAAFVRALPEVLDLGGVWNGELFVPGQAQRPITLDLMQGVDGGWVRLDGLLGLPDWPWPIVVGGGAQFLDGHYQVQLWTPAGAPLGLVLTGTGVAGPLRVDLGLLETVGGTPLPFTQGVFRILRNE